VASRRFSSARLQFVTALTQDSKELERSQHEHQEGPCRDAYETGEVVRVTDVRHEPARWPHYSATATDLGVAGVAGILIRHGDEVIGALNICSSEPRDWSDEDIAVAVVLANVATSYVLIAASLHDQEQLSEQLQQALDSRVVIEQAKGITAQRNTVLVDHACQLMRDHAATTTPACARSLRLDKPGVDRPRSGPLSRPDLGLLTNQ
jgi:GAF domain-containing protein